MNTLLIVFGCDRPLNQREIVGTFDDGARGLGEVGDFYFASNSSSQSSKLNWQPSQEANFQTASFGFDSLRILYLPLQQPVPHIAILEHRAVFANEVRPKLAMPTQANGALHVALHRHVEMFRRDPALLQLRNGETHHDFGATYESD
ncbi:MAG TPA: hypothetical protein VIY29_27815, partial [Ktedonobacteraceae bacterium]